MESPVTVIILSVKGNPFIKLAYNWYIVDTLKTIHPISKGSFPEGTWSLVKV